MLVDLQYHLLPKGTVKNILQPGLDRFMSMSMSLLVEEAALIFLRGTTMWPAFRLAIDGWTPYAPRRELQWRSGHDGRTNDVIACNNCVSSYNNNCYRVI
jgi:hypothetical protein